MVRAAPRLWRALSDQQQPRLVVIVRGAVRQQHRQRRAGVGERLAVHPDDAAEAQPAGVARQADEGDFRNDLAVLGRFGGL